MIQEALADDKEERLDSMVEHLLPIYSRVASLEEYVEATCGLEKFAESVSKEKNGDVAGGKRKKKKKNVCYFAIA